MIPTSRPDEKKLLAFRSVVSVDLRERVNHGSFVADELMRPSVNTSILPSQKYPPTYASSSAKRIAATATIGAGRGHGLGARRATYAGGVWLPWRRGAAPARQ